MTEREEHLSQCDCCGKMKYGCVDLWVSYVGDTHACPACRGDEEAEDRQRDARALWAGQMAAAAAERRRR